MSVTRILCEKCGAPLCYCKCGEKEMKAKCLIDIPPILLPVTPLDRKFDSPAYFTLPPKIRMLKRGGCILLDDVKFRDRWGKYRTTPRGFPSFDGMSYPWLVRKLTGWKKYDPETLRTAATHDCPYVCFDHFCDWPIPRKEIDIDLLDGLKCEQPKFAYVKYRAVRRFGWMPWGAKNYDPLFIQWVKKLNESDDALDEWIDRIVKHEAM